MGIFDPTTVDNEKKFVFIEIFGSKYQCDVVSFVVKKRFNELILTVADDLPLNKFFLESRGTARVTYEKNELIIDQENLLEINLMSKTIRLKYRPILILRNRT